MPNFVVLFSRDDRSFKLFRKSWIQALIDSKIPFCFKNRGFGLLKTGVALFNFIKQHKRIRIIFGTSEICLYSLFSSKDDIWVFTGMGRLLQYRGRIQSLTTFFLNHTYRQQKIVALNFQDAVYLESIFPAKVILINGEGFDFKGKMPIRQIKSPPFVVAYVGRLLKSKGVDRLVESFIELPHLNCELRLIGDFDFSNSDAVSMGWLAEMQSKSTNKISLYGYVDNVRDLLKDIDIYVSLSDREGLPFSVLEAIESGCLILLSPVPGHLSFADFDGIIYAEAKDLRMILENLLTSPYEYFNFDSHERVKICNAKFGMQSIISEIKSKIL